MIVLTTSVIAERYGSGQNGRTKTKNERSRPNSGSVLPNSRALKYLNNVSQWTVARSPATSEIAKSTTGRKRRISGSITTRPGRPSWSSSSQITSGAAGPAPEGRFNEREKRAAGARARESDPRQASALVENPG